MTDPTNEKKRYVNQWTTLCR